MMTRIRADLSEIKNAALADGDDRHWRRYVVEPMGLTVAGLIDLIDARQKGMDRQQEIIRDKIGKMLEQSWFEAIQSCETLLGSTSATLQELNNALMVEVEGVSQLLNEIDEIGERAGHPEVGEAVGHVRAEMERIHAWGGNRFQAWSEYYQSVHEFIRSVVRVDPDRAIRHRLRDALKSYGFPSWYLLKNDQAPFRHLREVEEGGTQKVVERSIGEREGLMERVAYEQSLIERLQGELKSRLDQEGHVNLMEILYRLEPSHTRDELYLVTGQLVEWMVRHGRPDPFRVSEWRRLERVIEIQDLTVYSEGPIES